MIVSGPNTFVDEPRQRDIRAYETLERRCNAVGAVIHDSELVDGRELFEIDITGQQPRLPKAFFVHRN